MLTTRRPNRVCASTSGASSNFSTASDLRWPLATPPRSDADINLR
jgi:hypothetical protein